MAKICINREYDVWFWKLEAGYCAMDVLLGVQSPDLSETLSSVRNWEIRELFILIGTLSDREEKQRDTSSLESRNAGWHISSGVKMYFKLGFWGKYLHFPAAVHPLSRDDIVPLLRRIDFRFLHHHLTQTWDVTFCRVQQTFSSKSITNLIQS